MLFITVSLEIIVRSVTHTHGKVEYKSSSIIANETSSAKVSLAESSRQQQRAESIVRTVNSRRNTIQTRERRWITTSRPIIKPGIRHSQLAENYENACVSRPRDNTREWQVYWAEFKHSGFCESWDAQLSRRERAKVCTILELVLNALSWM